MVDDRRSQKQARGLAMPYYVTGGAYVDTTFTDLVDPDRVEGPFEYYADAYLVWRGKSMAHVDDAFWRYEIVEAEPMPEAARATTEPAEEPSRAS
jgi:hypothetical protein